MAEYIDRDAFLAHMKRTGRYFDVKYDIENFPAADVSPVVHGRWIEDHDYLKCPECGVMVKWDFTFFDDIGDWNYCPACGAKMDGDSDG